MLTVGISMDNGYLKVRAICVSKEHPGHAPLPASFTGGWKSLAEEYIPFKHLNHFWKSLEEANRMHP